jgi:16S rRNA (cytidine1402-2'-O)-methyltransferase
LVEASKKRLVVFFEAPHKLLKTLAELGQLVNRPIIIGRELTKIHEEFVRGTPEELSKRFESPQGEFTVMIPPLEPGDLVQEPASDEDVVDLFGQITEINATGTKREAARQVGERLGMTAKQVYDILERSKLVK